MWYILPCRDRIVYVFVMLIIVTVKLIVICMAFENKNKAQ